MTEEQADYTTYSGYYNHKSNDSGKLYRWVGYFDLDIRMYVNAISEEQAQERMGKKLIELIETEEKPFCIFNTWEVVDEEV